MNYSAQKLAKYIDEKISLTPNSNWTIYEDCSKKLIHTEGSMIYRDPQYKKVMCFRVMDEVPKGTDLVKSVEFQMKNTNQSNQSDQ